MNLVLRILLAVWVLGYLLVSCGPFVRGDGGAAGFFGFIFGAVFLAPWVIGIIVLGLLVWLTNPGRPRP
jgi:hypothetical protein